MAACCYPLATDQDVAINFNFYFHATREAQFFQRHFTFAVLLRGSCAAYVLFITFRLYCLTVGRESTLALTIMGNARGPDLQPNYNVMDMGNIFMGSNNYYEVRK